MEVVGEERGAVGWMTLNRPSKGNSLNLSMVDSLVGLLEGYIASSTIRIIVLTGKGKYFCTGMELTPSVVSDSPTGAHTLFEKFYHCPKPIVVVLNGPVMGGGIGLVMCCDVRIAKKGIYLWFAEVKRGIFPAIISAYIVLQMGYSDSQYYMLTGERIPIALAHHKGWIHKLVDEAQIEDTTQQVLSLLLTSAPRAMRDIKSSVRALLDPNHPHHIKMMEKRFMDMVQSEEAKYGIQCFLTKQTPDWSTFSAKY